VGEWRCCKALYPGSIPGVASDPEFRREWFAGDAGDAAQGERDSPVAIDDAWWPIEL
jgi:hypothetical protein